MKKHFYSILLLVFCVIAEARSQSREVVCLKDGSKIKGMVTVNDSTGFVMVLSHRKFSFYPKSEVTKIEKEDAVKERPSRTDSLRTNGYACNIELGATDIIPHERSGGVNLLLFSLNVVNSYCISPYASIGLGLGTELSGNNIEMFSLYADSRIYFSKSDVKPYLNIALGYNAMFSERGQQSPGVQITPPTSVSSGMIVNPSLGIRVATGKKVALTASIGYKFYYIHNAEYQRNFLYQDLNYAYTLGHALTIRAGFQF